ncbi:glycosyltransferase [Acinetobacter sp. ANC 5383]
MKRVLHVIGKMDRAGAETMLMNLYRSIDRSKVQFDFITFTHEKGDYDDEIRTLGGKIIPIVASNSIIRMIKLRQFLKAHPQYNIIHAHMLLNNAFHLLAAQSAGIPYRISHSHNTSNGKTGLVAKLYEKISISLNKKLATNKIACGKEAAEYLFTSVNDTLILNNAIDLILYNKISINNKNYWHKIKKNHGLKIIQVGRLTEVKNHIFSLNLAKKLKQQDFDFTFFIIGQGPLKDVIQQKIIDYGLEDNVFLLGMREDIPYLMAGADLMLMPSLHEGFPVVLVESQAAELISIISTKISTEVDLGVNLIKFIDLDNIDEWLEKIKNINLFSLSNSESNLKILAKKGFDIKTNAANLLELYMSMEDI